MIPYSTVKLSKFLSKLVMNCVQATGNILYLHLSIAT